MAGLFGLAEEENWFSPIAAHLRVMTECLAVLKLQRLCTHAAVFTIRMTTSVTNFSDSIRHGRKFPTELASHNGKRSTIYQVRKLYQTAMGVSDILGVLVSQ